MVNNAEIKIYIPWCLYCMVTQKYVSIQGLLLFDLFKAFDSIESGKNSFFLNSENTYFKSYVRNMFERFQSIIDRNITLNLANKISVYIK